MEVVHTIAELQARADGERAAGRRLALVPTMGALHEGHLSLVREGRHRADRVWLTIFVNPTQFNDSKDLAGYPHSLDEDLAKCAAAGVDVVFAPSAQDMYPADSQTSEGSQTSGGSQTWVDVTQLGDSLCGGSRPGHFRGVTTVVAKLFLAAKPHVAIFGEKDYQQLAIVRRMVRDLNFDVEVVGAETVREADGVALSSRNMNLHPQARRQAPVLVRALEAAQRAVAAGERNREALMHLVRNEIGKAPLAVIDYAELRDPDTLEPSAAELSGPALLALAAHFHPPEAGQGASVRLIDSRILRP